MSQRWGALQHVMVSPTTIGDIAKIRARPYAIRAQDDHLKVTEKPH
jgi:hypothetical protein